MQYIPPKIQPVNFPDSVKNDRYTSTLSETPVKNEKRSKAQKLKKRDQQKLIEEWNTLDQRAKLILLLLSEHKTMSRNQLQQLCLLGYKKDNLAFSGWLNYLSEKYNTPLDPKVIFTQSTENTVYYKTLRPMKIQGIVDVVNYIMHATTSGEHPIAASGLYFLTEHGAQLICAGTGASLDDVGFVPNYHRYSTSSAIHNLNANGFFLNTVAAIQGIVDMNDPNTGILDFAAWKNEKESVHQLAMDGSNYFFRPDGFAILFSSQAGGFVPVYLEFDVGSSSADKIQHKTKTYIRYITTVFREQKLGRPMLLFVFSGNRWEFYEKNIKKAIIDGYEPVKDELNEYARILVTSTNNINSDSSMGKIWRVFDLGTCTYLKDPVHLLAMR